MTQKFFNGTLFALFFILFLFSQNIFAATYCVELTTDPGSGTAGNCDADCDDNACALRDAVAAANANNGADTIVFSSIGYKKGVYIIPDTLVENKYSLIQLLSQDTVMLAETVIYPWPTKEQFKYAFLHIDIPDDDLERAKNNLSLHEMKTRMENMPMDGSMNYKNYINNYTSKLYYIGQLPPNNLLNPLAWAQFIEAWRSGKFKNN